MVNILQGFCMAEYKSILRSLGRSAQVLTECAEGALGRQKFKKETNLKKPGKKALCAATCGLLFS